MRKVALIVGLAAALGFNNAQAVDWNWKGDVRERWEDQRTLKNNADTFSTSRSRTRVRLGVYSWINEELSTGVQLATGNDAVNETVSRNQSAGALFQPKNIYLNEAFIDYHPTALDGQVNLILGKRDDTAAIIRVNNLVYDSDLTFEGATVQYGKDADGKEKSGPIAIAGYYLLDSFSDTVKSDPTLFIAQAAYKGDVNDIRYMLGAGYNLYSSVDNISLTYGADKSGYAPSTVAPASTYLTRKGYRIVELFGNIGGQITDTLPWTIYGQYAVNTAQSANYANINNNRRNAWLAGLTIGDAKQVGQWSLDAKYDRIESDSVFPYFTDSDRKVVGTSKSLSRPTEVVNVKGFEVALTYHLVQNMTLGARYFSYNEIDKLSTNPTLHQLQADVVVKF
ncbi:MAG: putative porin [Chlorobiaceae bacterium]